MAALSAGLGLLLAISALVVLLSVVQAQEESTSRKMQKVLCKGRWRVEGNQRE